eukprot:COSAG04_NODE_17_length_40288_cov_9.152728_15_plen_979_part_00
MWGTVPLATAAAAFGIHAIQGKKLTIGTMFTSLALFDLIQEPMLVLPQMFSEYLVSVKSLGRVAEFLSAPELDSTALVTTPISRSMLTGNTQPEHSVHTGGGSFGYRPMPTEPDSDSESDSGSESEGSEEAVTLPAGGFVLEDLRLSIKPGELVGVVGPVGSGKSTLLSAILGETDHVGGEPVERAGTAAYAAQTPFLLGATIRENIVFGREVSEERLAEVVRACALEPDLATMPSGLDTEVGVDGVTLSGGQRSRIALARAVCGGDDVVLLDDTLSAVDAAVATFLWRNCISHAGVLSGSTRILVTHSMQFLQDFDRLLVMDDGKIVDDGPPAELKESQVLKELLQAQAESDEKMRQASAVAEEEQSSGGDDDAPALASDGIQQAGADEAGGLMDGSEKQDPTEGLRSMLTYLRHAGVGYGVVTVGLHALDVLLEVLSTQWLSWWAVDKLSLAPMAYLRGYVDIALLQSTLRVVRQVVAASSVMRAARIYHERCLSSLMGSALSFFHVTPHGRILTRFSGDLAKIDSNYHKEVFEVVDMGMQLLGTGCVLLLTSGWFILAVPPIALAYRRIQTYFTHATREVQHLAGEAEHPISSHLGESLAGKVTIRAFGQAHVDRFVAKHGTLTDVANQADWTDHNLFQWLDLTCSGIGTFVQICAALIALGQRSAGAIRAGLTIRYAMTVTDQLNLMVDSLALIQSNGVKVERLEEVAQLPHEPDAKDRAEPAAVQSSDWRPTEGRVEFRQLTMRYRRCLPPALNGVSFVIEPGWRVGVCGRTGAGKSSVLAGLLRLADDISGSIEIDGVDTATVPLATLRSSLSLIQQESTLFEGTIRSNLSPLAEHDDDQMLRALRAVGLEDAVLQAGGLEARVEEHGEGWSAGQRQLLGIARAMLRRSRVVLLDEATSSCDSKTDRLVQEAIAKHCEGSTVITIAHRLGTIADSDRIMVLDAGRVAEFGTPAELQRKEGGLYAQLLRDSAE